MQTDPRLSSLLLRWQQFRRQGRIPTAADLCADCPELTEALAQRIDALQSMAGLLSSAASPDTTAPHAPTLPSEQTLLEQAGRFRILGEIARGGMGAVLRAHDPAIGRDVAIKVILPRHRGDPETLRRFLGEARLTGQLQHPGVPPVYDVGELPDGSPYFAMKLIEGRTLAALLAERNVGHVCNVPDASKARYKRAPQEDDLPRFLRYFEVVCQAVGYAHSQGIIHRDLKPHNVMVGAFGEVQVMDWGLAKRLDAPRPSDAPVPVGEREQPEGTTGPLSTDAWETARWSRSETPACEGATPVDAGPLTDAGKVIGTPSYLPPEQARCETHCVGKASDVFGLGGILCVILTGEPPFRGKSLMDLLVQSSAGDLSDAFARLDGCGADAELVRLAKSCLAADPAQRPGDGAEAARQMGAYLGGVQQRLRASELDRAAAQARADEAAKKAAQERRARRVQLGLSGAALVVLLAGITGTTLGLQHAKKAWGAEAQQRQIAEEKHREAELSAERAAAEQRKAQRAEKETLEDYRASTDDAIEQLIGSKPALGPQEKTYLENTLKRWQVFAARTGDDERSRAYRAEGHFRLALLRDKLGQNKEAIAGYREALALLQKLADEFPAEPAHRKALAGTHNNLGQLLRKQNEREKAVQEFQKALAIKRQLADEFPSVPQYRYDLALTHNNLGILLATQSRWEKAVEQFHKALAIQQKLADEFPAVPDYRKALAGTFYNLGQYHKALPIRQKLADEFPAIPAYRQLLASTHNSLGNVLQNQKQWEKSAQQYQKALAIHQKLADEFPAVPLYRQELGQTHNNLGALLAGQEQWTNAAQQFHKALLIKQKLVDDFPTVLEYRIDLGASFGNYGALLCSSGKPTDSLPWFDRAIRTLTPVHEQNPRVLPARLALRNSYRSRAMAHDELGKYAEAVTDWTRAIELGPPQDQPALRFARADSRVRAGQVDESVAEVAQLRKSAPLTADQWYNFACIYALASSKSAGKKQEYADEAMRMLRRAVQAGYKDAAHMARDKDLEVLHGRGDFKKLLDEMGKAKAKPADRERE
jgi:serine/threonine protein kinase/Tfp pilus assembly protein PilF